MAPPLSSHFYHLYYNLSLQSLDYLCILIARMHISNNRSFDTIKILSEQMPLQLIRKLSFRNRRHVDLELPTDIRKASSCKQLKVGNTGYDEPYLPDKILTRIINLSSPIEQIRMRRVCTGVRDYVDSMLHKITCLDVKKADLCRLRDSDWYLHPSAQIAFRINETEAEVVVDNKWTSKDITILVGLMGALRKTVLDVTIDAPIAELIVVSLSALDLNRWYAFQCYMKAFDADVHLSCEFNNPGEVYWPNVQNLIVRTTEKQAPHLARVIDYGVQCNWVLDRRNLNRLCIFFTDIKASSKAVSRHLYHFRCWAGSAGFDHRYEQQFNTQGVIY